jgi:hypothetical protein
LRISMIAYNERAASKSGRARVILDQDIVSVRILKNVSYIRDQKKRRSKLRIESILIDAPRLHGDYHVFVDFSKDDLVQLFIEAFGKRSLVEAARTRPKRARKPN